MLRGAARRRRVGVPDVRLHPPDSGGRESGDRVHGPRVGVPRGLRPRPGTGRPDLGSRADGPRQHGNRELPAPRRRHVRDRRVPRHGGRAETPIGARAGRGRLEEIVELQVLRLVVREQRRDRVLDQIDPLAEIVRYLELLTDALRDLEVLLHGAFVDRQGEIPAAGEAFSAERDPAVLLPALRAADRWLENAFRFPIRSGRKWWTTIRATTSFGSTARMRSASSSCLSIFSAIEPSPYADARGPCATSVVSSVYAKPSYCKTLPIRLLTVSICGSISFGWANRSAAS